MCADHEIFTTSLIFLGASQVNFVGVRMILYGLIFLILVIIFNRSLIFQLPQWILLVTIGLLLKWDSFKNIIIHITD